MKYKGKKIETHLRENVIVANLENTYIPPRRFSCIKYPDDRLYLGDASISLDELKIIYGPDVSKDALIEKGKDYLIKSVLNRYTVTQRSEPGVKAMFCKAHIVEAFGISGIPKDVDIFIPIFACVSIPRHSVIYTSNDDTGKRRASAGKITNILWYPTHKLVRCLVVPKKPSLYDKSVYITVNLLSGITDDNQTIMEVRNGHLLSSDIYSSRCIECALRIEFDDYNPKTRTTDTVYSIFETEKYVNRVGVISNNDYTPLARHIGYSVKIDNFDITPTTCSTGFHFFDSVDEAANYISM